MYFFRNSADQVRRVALKSFVLGERSLRAYLGGGNVRFLEEAEANFGRLRPSDKRYDEARFLLGITKTQLRKSNDSIDILQDLRIRNREKKDGGNPNFDRKISLQLAFANIKKYTDAGYAAAEKELEDLIHATKDEQLRLQAQSIQAFLYAVMAGRSKEFKAQRPHFARTALELGEELLKMGQSSLTLRFEPLNE